MVFKIKIESDARQDIQEAISWYNEKKKGLGRKFHSEVSIYINSLKKIQHFKNRYDDVHCLPLKKHPYMIHYTFNVEEKIVYIRSVFHTSLSPNRWKK